jgi:hypothetical protein
MGPYRPLGHEAIDHDGLGLSNPMRAVHRLQVRLVRVRVRVKVRQ